MGLRTPEQYFHGLRDDREIYYKGRRVKLLSEHPDLDAAAHHASIDFALAEDPEFRDLAVHREGNETYSAYYRVPRDSKDLIARTKLIEAGTAKGATLVILIKEIGTDAIFALKRLLARAQYAEGLSRVNAFYQRCREKDLALAVAQTDVKGDRSKRPSEQSDPDMYVRVVSERPDGIVVRGAKIHTSCTPYVDEVIVLPFLPPHLDYGCTLPIFLAAVMSSPDRFRRNTR
jgi:4-hydroxybutyryl-CoA dehydratase / vinylacetyl-CoA-Delta-isomerase